MNFLNKKVMPRYFLVTLLLCIVGASVVAKAVYTMTVDRDWWLEMSTLQTKHDRPLPAKRGNILAADGQVLAASLPQYKLYIDFMTSERDSLLRVKDQERRDTTLNNNIDSICAGMHRIFPDIDARALRRHLKAGRAAKSRCWPVYVDSITSLKLRKNENRQITYVEYSEVRKLPLFSLRSSLNAEVINMRKRPYGRLAIRTIGEFKDSARYGLELSFDSVLAGKPGRYHFEKVRNRRVQVVDQPAEDGCDIVTTLDAGMQEICEKALADKLAEIEAPQGICILMEVATGDIKAMTSLMRASDGTYYEDHAAAVTDLYEPGSVFKPQSFLVAFDDGLLKMNEYVDVRGGIHAFGSRKMKDHNWRSGGYKMPLDVAHIIGNSSNVGVSVLIDRYYQEEPRKFVDGLYRVGSAEDLRIPLPGYQKPRIRRPGEGAYWSRTTLPWMSIGYETQVAPINTLNFYNGIANNGKLLRPRLVKAVMRGSEVVKEYPVEVLRENMAKPEAVANVRKCLETVTTDGVGKAANSKLFATAGKTGTAQIWTGGGRTSEYFITFAGYFPADKPLYSCIVCIRKPAPASGGGMCGPVFRRVAESVMAQKTVADYSQVRDTVGSLLPARCNGDVAAAARLFSRYGISSSGAPAADPGQKVWGAAAAGSSQVDMTVATLQQGVMPDVQGYGLRDAVHCLEGLGLKVRTQGVGTVCRQSIAPGTKFRRGTLVTLHLDYRKARAPHAAYAAHKPAPAPAPSAGPDGQPATEAGSAVAPKDKKDKPEEKADKPKSGAGKKKKD